jgi:hypothetical protein
MQIEIRVLDLSNNQISEIEGIDTLVHLQEFWVRPCNLCPRPFTLLLIIANTELYPSLACDCVFLCVRI